jgi:hypothetical protein
LLIAPPIRAGGLAILNTALEDNGDDDGFADTSETVSLRLTVQNTSGMNLTDITVVLSEVSERAHTAGTSSSTFSPRLLQIAS